jgi:enamine deaminase RidA (YjgF/YER057c/UK114 family)
MNIKRHFSDSAWEEKAQFCRALSYGGLIYVAGTAALDARGVVAPGDAEVQARFILEKIETAVKALGGRRETILRTRMFVTRKSDADAVAAAHASFFKGIYPVTTMVFIDGLVDENLVVEIEAEAAIAID